MQIAIDGPAGAGKSTIAKIIAKKYGILYLDTGAMYRAITFAVWDKKEDFNNPEKIIALAKESVIDFEGKTVLLNGKDITEAIRMPIISKHTSDVACIGEVRAHLVKEQQKIAGNQSVIMDGRDIGSVVLPHADYKIFLDASIDERAERRMKEFCEKGIDKTFEAIREDIKTRDYNDSHRKESPLICTEDAVVIDTTGKNIEAVCDEISRIIDGGRQ